MLLFPVAGNEVTKREAEGLSAQIQVVFATAQSTRKRATMGRIIKAYVNGRMRRRDIVSHRAKSQTMTEYALILTAIAITAYLSYQLMGQDIGSMVTGKILD